MAHLPDQADDDVEQVAPEVAVRLDARVLGPALLVDRPPEAPRPHGAVEALEHLVLLGLRQQADADRGDRAQRP